LPHRCAAQRRAACRGHEAQPPSLGKAGAALLCRKRRHRPRGAHAGNAADKQRSLVWPGSLLSILFRKEQRLAFLVCPGAPALLSRRSRIIAPELVILPAFEDLGKEALAPVRPG